MNQLNMQSGNVGKTNELKYKRKLKGNINLYNPLSMAEAFINTESSWL